MPTDLNMKIESFERNLAGQGAIYGIATSGPDQGKSVRLEVGDKEIDRLVAHPKMAKCFDQDTKIPVACLFDYEGKEASLDQVLPDRTRATNRPAGAIPGRAPSLPGVDRNASAYMGAYKFEPLKPAAYGLTPVFVDRSGRDIDPETLKSATPLAMGTSVGWKMVNSGLKKDFLKAIESLPEIKIEGGVRTTGNKDIVISGAVIGFHNDDTPTPTHKTPESRDPQATPPATTSDPASGFAAKSSQSIEGKGFVMVSSSEEIGKPLQEPVSKRALVLVKSRSSVSVPAMSRADPAGPATRMAAAIALPGAPYVRRARADHTSTRSPRHNQDTARMDPRQISRADHRGGPAQELHKPTARTDVRKLNREDHQGGSHPGVHKPTARMKLRP